jgi:hypothetical protein
MLVFFTSIFILVWILLMVWLFLVKEGYENWDFMDLADYCGGRKRKPSQPMNNVEFAPKFGGVPNQSQVWGIGDAGGCGCAKVFH